MAVMIEGRFHEEEPAPSTTGDGSYNRAPSVLRDWVTPKTDPARLHLYGAWNCPWAHRVVLTRLIRGLDGMTLAYARPRRTAEGWVYDAEGAFSDPALGVSALHEVYARHQPAYTGRITTPVLWDKVAGRIISTDSGDMVRMLGRLPGPGPDLCPPVLEAQIDSWNERLHKHLNNGVYRAGFARTQTAYDEAVREVFDTLEAVEAQLDRTRYLLGDALTESDLRLFPTLVRFDVAYHYAFKCNLARIRDYPNLWSYARRLYHLPGVAETVRFEVYKNGYFSKSELRNPLGIVPAGPVVDWSL